MKLSEGTSTSWGGSTTVHSLARKTHLCLLPSTSLLERVCVGGKGPLHPPGPSSRSHGDPTPMASCSLVLQPHLVKRSQGLGPRPSSGADQRQSILTMLLLRQMKDPAPGPGTASVERTLASGLGPAADTATGQSPNKDPGRRHQGQGGEVMGSDPCGMGGNDFQAGPRSTGPSTIPAKPFPMQ